MKKLLLTIGITLLVGATLLAQAPQAFKYQAIARDVEGNVIADQQVSLRINLLQGSEAGQAVYSETHDLRTNQFGLLNLEIGNGKNKSGDFSDINWGLSKYYVNIEMDANGGSDFKSMGVSPLLSVPYALYAETSGDNNKEAMSWTEGSGLTYLTNTNNYVGIGLNNPSARLHIDTKTGNLNSGIKLFLSLENSNSKYRYTGIDFFSYTSGLTGQLLISGNTYNNPIVNLPTNSFGFFTQNANGSLVFHATGSGGDIRMGTGGYGISNERLRIDVAGNVGIGLTSPSYKLDVAGDINYTGNLRSGGNTIFSLGLPGVNNTFVGQTGNITNTGTDNTFVGFMAGNANVGGTFNTFLGSNAGLLNVSGNSNTFVGHGAGATNTQGNYSVCLGNNAGPAAGDIDHKLYINHQAGTPLIYGDFNNVYVGIATTTPGTNFAIYEKNSNITPALLIQQDDPSGQGDAAMRFWLSAVGSAGISYSVGIDNDDNYNWKITDAPNLIANLNPPNPMPYNDQNTMMRIHSATSTGSGKGGIIDFNHQSRARVSLDAPFSVSAWNQWKLIPFDSVTYDEHTEWNIVPGQISEFIALEEGYYQVNARTEVIFDYQPIIIEDPGAPPPNLQVCYTVGGYCSIAIFKEDISGFNNIYAQGNNLDLRGSSVIGGCELPPLIIETNNNAPNVSDVVYLQAGEKIRIYVKHTAVLNTGGTPTLFLRTGGSQTYCSIHKVS